jgi:hypothetical protein
MSALETRVGNKPATINPCVRKNKKDHKLLRTQVSIDFIFALLTGDDPE